MGSAGDKALLDNTLLDKILLDNKLLEDLLSAIPQHSNCCHEIRRGGRNLAICIDGTANQFGDKVCNLSISRLKSMY